MSRLNKTTAAPTPLEMSDLEQCARALRVLAHPHRLKIVELLMGGQLSVGDLAEAVGLAPSAVSQHLSHMRAHGILGVNREGRTAYYRVEDPSAKNVIDCIRRHGSR
jgi:ArsR family transcriptional regulator, zinc-responsive transcriptional repressor